MIRQNLEILLVKDNLDDVELTLHALHQERLANHIDVTRDGEEAPDFLVCRGPYAHRSFEQAPRVVLLDLKLPEVEGMEVLRGIKKDPSHQSYSRGHSNCGARRVGHGQWVLLRHRWLSSEARGFRQIP